MRAPTELHATDWTGAEHAYGDGADTLKWLLDACGEDQDRAERAVGVLHNCLVHQGSVYAGSAKAYPVLVDLLLDPTAPGRATLADLLLGITIGIAETEAVHHEIRAAHARATPLLLPLLADPTREVRHRLAYVTGLRTGHEELAVRALAERALSEPDPLIAAVMTGGVARHDIAGRAARLSGALAPRHTPAVRAAAAWGIAQAGLPWTTEVTTAVTEAWEHGEVLNGDVIEGEQWRWSDNPLAETLIAMADPVRAAEICLRLTQSEDQDTAECGAVAAVALLEELPHAYPAFAPVIAATRAHRDTQIRSYADDLDALAPADEEGHTMP
ncbi:hypothetical protein [Streptomyces platensis]|uniref:hypothetical protein n=1 Tax=Streptomyces platensis TaxID=58346 RepID=UPI001F3E85C3|nr:hypothetical protein [Streptomyces platensis]MCF3144242.1 hypothetical protein [Streptomyces platensis]